MVAINISDDTYETISKSHTDVSEFVNRILNQFAAVNEKSDESIIKLYTNHGNAD